MSNLESGISLSEKCGDAVTKRKANPLIRWHVTLEEKREIHRLRRTGMTLTSIARRMHLTRNTVAKWAGPKPPIPEAAILDLIHQGIGQLYIHELLHVSVRKIHQVAVKHGIQYANAKTPKENEERFSEAVIRGENYIRTLAQQHRVAKNRAHKLAHEIRETIKFAPGPSKPPLSSNFPQRHHPCGGLST